MLWYTGIALCDLTAGSKALALCAVSLPLLRFLHSILSVALENVYNTTVPAGNTYSLYPLAFAMVVSYERMMRS